MFQIAQRATKSQAFELLSILFHDLRVFEKIIRYCKNSLGIIERSQWFNMHCFFIISFVWIRLFLWTKKWTMPLFHVSISFSHSLYSMKSPWKSIELAVVELLFRIWTKVESSHGTKSKSPIRGQPNARYKFHWYERHFLAIATSKPITVLYRCQDIPFKVK